MSIDRKAASREYRETARPAGVYSIVNTTSGATFLGSSLDVPSMLNRAKFQLEMGSWPSREVQADWNACGADAFEFAVVDLIERPEDDPSYDPADDVVELEQMWRERMAAEGTALYPALPLKRTRR